MRWFSAVPNRFKIVNSVFCSLAASFDKEFALYFTRALVSQTDFLSLHFFPIVDKCAFLEAQAYSTPFSHLQLKYRA